MWQYFGAAYKEFWSVEEAGSVGQMGNCMVIHKADKNLTKNLA